MARRQNYRTVPIQGTPNSLVLGLTWQTVLGQDLEVAALRAARQGGATHYTQSGARSPAVGLFQARGKERRMNARARLYSAAAAFSQLHRHGAHIAWAPLTRGEIWIAVVADGVVQAGGDMVLANADAAHKTLAGLTKRYSEAFIHGADSEGALPFNLHQLAGQANAQSALRRAAFRLSMVSPVWWVLLGVVATYLVWSGGVSWFHAKQARERARLEAMQTSIDAKALWQTALSNWARSVRVDGEAGLAHLLDEMARIPVAPGRWTLVEADCQPAAGTCTAQYRRPTLADSNTLRNALPSDWHITYTTIDEAKATWKLPKPTSFSNAGLHLGDLPTKAALELAWMPGWQALKPALLDFSLAAPAAVSVRAPNVKLPNGLEQPVEMPAAMSIPQSRKLVINGPLLSLYGLALPATSSITQLQMRYQPDAQPKLDMSRISATLTGTVYVQPK